MNQLQHALQDYQEVYTKGAYHFVQKDKMIIKFVGKYFRFQTATSLINEEITREAIRWVNNDTQEEYDFTLIHEFDRQMSGDSFYLEITSDKNIVVRTQHMRGLRYAIEALMKGVTKRGDYWCVPIVTVAHEPSFNMRGVIEGFYGIPWTHEDRLDVIRFLGEERMNTYMYAPKDDELQRKKWREHYSEADLEKFKELLAESESQNVDFYYMISPGNDIDYTQPSEIKVLTDKLKQMIDLGIRNFGLLLDDIDYILKGQPKIIFEHSAIAHAFLVNQVNDYLKQTLATYTLVACPTEYDNHHDSLYLELLNEHLAPEVPLFWTGPATLAAHIRTEDIQTMAQAYQRPIVIWDNIPVNDYLKDYELLFLSPYESRSPRLADTQYQVVGVVSNPMAQWEASKLTILSMRDFLWDSDGFNLDASWQDIIQHYAGEEFAEAMLTWAAFNPNHFTRETVSLTQSLALMNEDEEQIEAELKRLYQAAQKLHAFPNDAFQKAVGPWLVRAEKDWDVWQAYRAGDVEGVREKLTALQDYPHRIGTDLIARYVAPKVKERESSK